MDKLAGIEQQAAKGGKTLQLDERHGLALFLGIGHPLEGKGKRPGHLSLQRRTRLPLHAAREEAGRALTLVQGKGIWAWAGEAVLTLVETATAATAVEATSAIEEFAAGLAGRDAPIAAELLHRCSNYP